MCVILGISGHIWGVLQLDITYNPQFLGCSTATDYMSVATQHEVSMESQHWKWLILIHPSLGGHNSFEASPRQKLMIGFPPFVKAFNVNGGI